MQIIEAAIPSPTVSVVKVGPFSVHLYAICILAGILIALWLTDRRWRARGGAPHQVGDVAGWAVLFGIVGGRLYHVITDPELYFAHGKHPLDAVKIWDGGLGIWGAVALGALGAWIGCRRHKMDFAAFADSAAPGVLLAQAIGRWGNWFNNELYGRATTLPWKLQIHDVDVISGKATKDAAGHPIVLGYYHPTFLYEMLWNLAVVALLLWADRRRLLGRGQVLALYVMGYTFGRFWVEALRDDHANRILGMRVNSWVSILVFLGALAWFVGHRNSPRSVAGPVAGPVAEPAAGQERADHAVDQAPADQAVDQAPAGQALASQGTDHTRADQPADQAAEDASSHPQAVPAIDSSHVQQPAENQYQPPSHGSGSTDSTASSSDR